MNPHDEARWRAWLMDQLASVTGRPVGASDVDRPLREFGVSSRDAVAITAAAAEMAGRPLPSTLVWTAPTIAELARAIATGAEPVATADDQTTQEAVAVVGVACRFPGASTPAGFWRLLTEGRDAVGEVPAGRWARFAPDLADHDLPRFGAFLDDVAAFDAAFFGISPDEAAVLDPQQRLLLEVTWEALAGAGIPADALRGTDCGVFVGLSATEYAQLTMTDLDRVGAFSATGAAASVTANRVSYALGVHGPSVTVDTACSSSLVAVHQAVRALTDGDATSAVVGGVNLLLAPTITAAFQRTGLLAEDGRCKPFDAAADGIVRGEGCGVVVLKRLVDARAAGDRVLAVIRGSAVNSDGRSNGLMAPNPAAQQRLLARAYARAGVRPRTVDYVEAHGTGTQVGDPIEAGALAEVLGAGRRPDAPLLIGSVKANLGHLEGAAGIAGLIKVVLGLWHSRIPPTPHHRVPNPHIDFAEGGLAVQTENTDWPRYAGLARAGVSAFGFGGTNAHVVLEEPPRAGIRTEHPHRTEIVVLAEQTPARLRARAAALAEHDEESVPALAAALAHATGDAPARAAVLADDRDELTARLRALADDRPDPAVIVATAPATRTDPVFVFSGHGSQWPGMGRRLLTEEPAFAAAVRDLDDVFGDLAGVTLTRLLTGPAENTLSRHQLALFGMQVALAELWLAHGVRPAAVLGHSVGEVAAAVVAGGLTPDDGLRVMLRRTEVLDEAGAAGGGAMAVVELAADDVAGSFPGVGVAVYAAPDQCTVSGPAEHVAALVARVEAGGGLARMLPAGVAGHSAVLDPWLGGLMDALAGLRPRPAEVGVYSSVLTDPRQAPVHDAAYWAANLRRPVRFTQAIAAAMDDGHRLFVEISPHPVAAVAAERTGAARGVDVVVVPTLRRDPDDTEDGFAAALAALCAHGRPGLARGRYPERVVLDLPGPVWQHRPYWAAAVHRRAGHPWLGDGVAVPGTTQRVWRADVGLDAHPWLARHTLHGVPVLPPTALVELMRAAAGGELRDVSLDRLLPLGEHTEAVVSVAGDAVAVRARVAGDWVCCATATAVPADGAVEPVGEVLAEVTHPGGAGWTGSRLHPALLEAALGDRACGFDRVRVTGDLRRATVITGTGSTVQLQDAGGGVLAELTGITRRPVARADVPHLPEHLAYQGEWLPSGRPAVIPSTGDWMVLYADGANPGELVGELTAAGQRVRTGPLGSEPVTGTRVVVLSAPGADRELTLAVTAVVRALADQPTRLWLVTRDAIAVRPGETGDPGQAALRGLVRVLAFEHPELHATLLDVDDLPGAARELLADGPEDEVALRGGQRFAHTLTRATLPDQEPVIRDGAYLITGGLGGLGLAAARWLADNGATRLVLCARGERALPTIAAQVEVVTGDIADPGVAERMVQAAGDVPVRGVLHAAGAFADAAVLTMTAEDLAAVWRAKTTGARRLHEACAGLDLDWWLAYSSVAGLVGSPGQAAYATANAWLDAFVAWRRAQGLPAATIQWGSWAEIGGAAGKDNPLLEPMPPGEGIAALAAVLASGRDHTAITRLAADTVLDLFPRLAERPFFSVLAPEGDTPVPDLVASDPVAVRDHLTALVAGMMWREPETLDPHAPLTSLGLDSLLAMRARGAVERDFGVTLPLPLLLRGASLTDLADHLVAEKLPRVTPPGPGTRDHTERWLARTLREIVGGPEPAVHQPVDLGGETARRLLAAVGAELGRPVTSAELFAVPTIAGMADVIRTEVEGAGEGPVRRLGGARDGAPLFLCHAAGSPTAVYRPLARLLPATVTCYGLERLDELDTVSRKAARYAELITEHQPAGPYRLGGWSFGGMLAFETARQLSAAGAEIELLFLIDTIIPLPDTGSTPDAALRSRLRRFVDYVEQTYQVDLGLCHDELLAMPEPDRDALVMRRLAERVAGMGDAVLTHQQTSYVDARISEQYTPGDYPGPVLLFRAKDPHPLTTTLDPRYLRTDDALGWHEFCQDLEVVKVPGDHITVIDPPHVTVIADRISTALQHR
jgi:phthiocerol/phenolphthiocerol synthesis type-I polyketide synthase D